MTERFIILINVAIGIEAFHAKNVLHYDIKSENVLFPEEISEDKIIVTAKLADYGISMDLNSEKIKFIYENKETLDEFDCATDQGFTYQYAPKEFFLGDLRNISLKSDIYSFGILMWEVFTESIPFENVSNDFIFDAMNEELNKPFTRKLENGEIEEIAYLEGTPNEIKDLIKKCVNDEIEERPKITEIVEELIEIQKNNNLTHLNA